MLCVDVEPYYAIQNHISIDCHKKSLYLTKTVHVRFKSLRDLLTIANIMVGQQTYIY